MRKVKKMGFFVAMLIVMIACLAITYKTLAGYGHLPLWAKLLILALLTIAWFSPMILRIIRDFEWLGGTAYAVAAKSSYFLMGFAFILFMILLFRDVIWYIVYYISHNPELSPDNVRLLNRNNLIAVAAALLISLYSVYEANKTPAVKEINITDERVKEETRLVVASDLHIDRATPLWQIRQIVDATRFVLHFLYDFFQVQFCGLIFLIKHQRINPESIKGGIKTQVALVLHFNRGHRIFLIC